MMAMELFLTAQMRMPALRDRNLQNQFQAREYSTDFQVGVGSDDVSAFVSRVELLEQAGERE
jgi:hypothetical protein